MNFLSIGDLAQSYRLRNHEAQMKHQIQRLTEEVTTGLRADTAAAVSGDFSVLAGIDRALARIEAYRTAAAEATGLTDTVQAALSTAQDLVGEAMPGLISASLTMTDRQIDTLALDARQRLGSAVSALNARTADRYALSGTTTDIAPLPDAGVLIAAAQVAVAGQTTAGGIANALQAWFDAAPGAGGYIDQIYRGAQAALAPLRFGDGEAGRMALTAAGTEVRDTLRGFTLAALVDAGALTGDRAQRADLLRRAGETLATADGGLTAVRADLGTLQDGIDGAATRNASERHRLQIARNDMLAADPYETASALEAMQSQTETLYTVTGRLARLRLADYLK